MNSAPRLSRPVEIKIQPINNQQYTTQKITNILKISKSGVENQVYQIGYDSSFDV